MPAKTHQQNQQEVIDQIANQVRKSDVRFSTVPPVEDYVNDRRISLTSVHLPHQDLLDQVQRDLIEPLREIEPDFFYYPDECLHMTIKNIRVTSDPPRFTDADVRKAETIFTNTVPQHKKFAVYFYRLLLFPHNLSLLGTTDEELDSLVLDLDQKLNAAGIPDDKVYTNSRYFFSNMTLARFNTAPSASFVQKVVELSRSVVFKPYQVDSVTLLACNAVLAHKEIKGTWKLK